MTNARINELARPVGDKIDILLMAGGAMKRHLETLEGRDHPEDIDDAAGAIGAYYGELEVAFEGLSGMIGALGSFARDARDKRIFGVTAEERKA
jgi:hypothetical protein